MPYTIEDYKRDIVLEVIGDIPVDRLLKGLPADEVLKYYPAEQRVKGLPADIRLKGLPTDEVLKRYPADEVLNALLKNCAPKKRKKVDSGGRRLICP